MFRKALKKFLEGEKPGPEPDTGYTVGVSTGIPDQNPTPAGRIGYSMTKGVNFIELAVEHPVAMSKREIDEIKRIKDSMGIKLAMHAGFETYMESPCDMDYISAEKQLDLYIDAASKIKAVYIDFHACVLARPRMYSIPRRYDFLVDENGDNIIKKITKKTPKLLEWFFESREIAGRYDIRKIAEGRVRRKIMSIEQKSKEGGNSDKTMEEVDKIIEDEVKNLRKELITEWGKNKRNQPWYDHGTEDVAYEIMGRWMCETRDPLWKTYCGSKSYEDAKEEESVAAVSAKYIAGHLKKHLEKLEEKNVVIALECPDARGGQYAGEYRLQTSTEIYKLVKHIGSPYVRILIDFEHLATQGIDPMKDVKDAPADIGNYVITLHVGTVPMPAHKHMPAPRGDTYIYELVWRLRQKGFDKGIFIFERGGAKEEELYEQIVITLKDVAKYVSKDIAPDQLPEEYFGMTPAEMEHEKRVVDSHTFDPLTGMFELPELSHTWLGREAMGKKSISRDTWRKEEHR